MPVMNNFSASGPQAPGGLTPDELLDENKKTGRVDDARKLDVKRLPDLLTVREVADLLRVSPLTIKRWGKRGKLPAIRINTRGDRRYKKEAVLWLLGMGLTDES